MNRIKFTLKMARQGYQDSITMGLTDIKNWTPVLVWVHISRLIIGFLLGVLFGLTLSLGIFL